MTRERLGEFRTRPRAHRHDLGQELRKYPRKVARSVQVEVCQETEFLDSIGLGQPGGGNPEAKERKTRMEIGV